MHALFARFLLALPLVLSASVIAAGIKGDGHSLYRQVAPQLAKAYAQLRASCADGDAQACRSLQNLDTVLTSFEKSDTACLAGDVAACRDLNVGVGLLLVGMHCQEGDAKACEQLERIEALAPACDEGDEEACQQIEFALFGT